MGIADELDQTLLRSVVGMLAAALIAGFAILFLDLSGEAPPSAGSANVTAPDFARATAPGSTRAAASAYAKLPLRFEPNRGQTDAQVEFLARAGGVSLFLTRREAVLSLTRTRRGAIGSPPARDGPEGEATTTTLRIRPVGANPDARMIAGDRQPGHSNYLIGADPGKWHKGVPGYGRVGYRDIYPGIDLVYHGSRGALEYDFVLAPHADPARITLRMKGASGLSIDRRGGLIIQTAGGPVRHARPFVYQGAGKAKKRVSGHYVLQGEGRVGFEVGPYDEARPLVIDPVLAYSTYLGGSATDSGRGIAVEDGCLGNCAVYLAGETNSSEDFPKNDPLPEEDHSGAYDVFVAKLNPSGSALEYRTFLGGWDYEEGHDIAVDASGNAYVTGFTSSESAVRSDCPDLTCEGFPTTTGQGFGGGTYDAFVTKLAPDGSEPIYSAFLGGALDDQAFGIALAPGCTSTSTCEAHLTGRTGSANFPTENALQPTYGGGDDPFVFGFSDAFVTKLNASGSDYVYSTYLGGSANDNGSDIAVDGSGDAYVTGGTASRDFPIEGEEGEEPYQSDLNRNEDVTDRDKDVFVTKLADDGSEMPYSTYVGGSDSESGEAIAVDVAGSAYLTGLTSSTDFLGEGPDEAYQDQNFGFGDAFATKLDPSGSALSWSTYLGGANVDWGTGIAVDPSGSAHVSGRTLSGGSGGSAGFPVECRPGTFCAGHSGSYDAFATRFAPSGASVSYSALIGGSESEGNITGVAIAVDRSGSAYVSGTTNSEDFPTASSGEQEVFQDEPADVACFGPCGDAFVTKLSPPADMSLAMTAAPDPVDAGQTLTYTLTARNEGPEDAVATVRDALPAGVAFMSAPDCSEAAGVVTCELGLLASGNSAERRIVVRPGAANPALSNTASVQSGGVDRVASNDSAEVTTVVRPAPVPDDGGSGDAGDGGDAPAPGTGGPRPDTGPSSGSGSGGGDSAGPPAVAEPPRVRRLRACLMRVRRHGRRERILGLRRHMRRHVPRLRRRCVARYGRAPGRVTGLRARARSDSEIVLSFRAPGTDGRRGPAPRAYLVKQATRPIRGRRGFRRAQTLCNGACRFDVVRAGTSIRLTITDLAPRTTYYYAIAARDNVSRRPGPRSQTVKATTG